MNLWNRLKSIYDRFTDARCVVIGACTTAVSVGLVALLTKVFHREDSLSYVVSFISAVIFAYVANKISVLRAERPGKRRGASRGRQLRPAMRRKTVVSLMSMLLASILLGGCTAGNTSGEVYSDTAFMLDTVVSVKIYGMPEEDARDAAAAAFSEISRLEGVLSANIPDNGISLLAQNAGSGYTELDDDAVYVLKKAVEYAVLTGGAFDPTVGPVVALWNIRNGTGYVPTAEERTEAAALVDYKKVSFDGKNGVMLADAGMSVNLGAIAKGYIADRVKELLTGMGVEHAVISLGGNVLAFGGKPDGSDFVIGIQDPFGATGEITATVAVRDMSVVSSGDYERYFEADGVRYHHIMDPFSGAPADSGLSGVTILSDKSVDGDALSTAVFVLGRNEGLELVESLDGVECVLIGSGGERTVSSGLKDRVVFR